MTTVERFEQNIDQVNSDFQAIKSKLIECGVEVADGTRTAELADKVGQVYEAGKKSEYDAFWDDYQDNGDRVNYNYGFFNKGWTGNNFRPKYDIRPTRATQMFAESNITDLVGILEECGVTLDFSQTTNIYMTFYWCTSLTRVGVVDTRACTNGAQTFYYLFGSDEKLKSIEKLILKDDGSQVFSNTFSGCINLQELRIEGVIGQNGVNLQQSPRLSKASITSIINALSTTTSDLAVTLSKTAVDTAFEEEGGAVGSVSTEWENLVATKKNWTISLI